MAKGQRTKAGHIIQMIYHGADPNRFNPNGKRVVAHNAEDYDYIDGIEFDKLGRKGANALIANVPLEEMWTGKISGPLHYNLMDDQIFPFWIAKGVETPITIDGVNCIDTEYVRPQLDRADREFFSIEEGKAGGGAALGCYGMLTSFKWTSKRGNKGKSRFEVGFVTQAAVRRNSLTGGTMQNSKFRVNASSVAGDLVVSYLIPGAALAKQVTMSVGDTAAQTKAKFEGNGDGVAVTATGTVALGAGERHNVNGTGALTVYGIDVFSKTIATLQAAIRALDAAHSTANVAGTITQAAASTSYTVTGAGYSPVNLTYTKNANGYGSPNGGRIYNQGGNTWIIQGDSGDDRYSGVGTTTAPPLTGWTTINQGVAPPPTLSAIGGAPASASLTITYDAAAGNIADLTFVGAGYTGASTQPGGAGGAIDLEFTAPANVRVQMSKVSGNAGYVLVETQPGSDGSILQAMKADDPIMPGHLFLYSADTPAGLDDEANMVGQIGEWEIDDPKICMPVSHHVRISDPERPNLPATYDAHAEEESQEDGIKLSVTMDANDDGQVITTMQSLLRASGSRLVSVPRYWRIAAIHPGSPQRVFLDFYGSVGAAVPVKWGGSVEQYTFVYDLLENKTAPWNFKAKTRRLA